MLTLHIQLFLMGIPLFIYAHFSGGKPRVWCVNNLTVLLLIERHVKTVIVFLVYELTRHVLSDMAVGAVFMAC
jgi:hypothetical protein